MLVEILSSALLRKQSYLHNFLIEQFEILIEISKAQICFKYKFNMCLGGLFLKKLLKSKNFW